jgi:hypothetical protein
MMWFVGMAAVVVLYRWALKLSTPKRDTWQLEEWAIQADDWLTRKVSTMRLWLFLQLGLTDRLWRRLRTRYQHGAFGEAGT